LPTLPLILLSQKVAGRPRENHLFLEIPGSPRRLRWISERTRVNRDLQVMSRVL
jgi:hypothetical protein